MEKLKINIKGEDYSLKLEEYHVGQYGFSFLTSDSIFIGFSKPVTNLWIELGQAKNINAGSIVVKNDTSSGQSVVEELEDNTFNFSKSGNISWKLASDKEQRKVTRFGVELFWYEITFSNDTSSIDICGINKVFSKDDDLIEEYPSIIKFLPEGKESFIAFHQSARKDIVQAFRNKGRLNSRLLTQYDILESEEVRAASKYLTLSKIFSWLSDARDDNWAKKAEEFYQDYSNFINLAVVTIDENNDGKVSSEEKKNVQFVQVVRA